MNRQCRYMDWRRRVKKFGASALPSLHDRKEGWPSNQWNVAKPPLIAWPGWFSDQSERKTTPSASASVASRNFIDDAATPPCGDARRGVCLLQNIRSASRDLHCRFIRYSPLAREGSFSAVTASRRDRNEAIIRREDRHVISSNSTPPTFVGHRHSW